MVVVFVVFLLLVVVYVVGVNSVVYCPVMVCVI